MKGKINLSLGNFFSLQAIKHFIIKKYFFFVFYFISKKRNIFLLCLVTALDLAHISYLYTSVLPAEAQWRHYDVFRLVELPAELSLSYACMMLITLYFFYLLYFSEHSGASILLYHVVLLGQSGWFLEPTIEYRRKKICICAYSRWLSLLVVNVLQVFTLVIGKFFLIFF